jgi:hypothetical protein
MAICPPRAGIAGYGQQRCCLARAVRAKERDDLPLVDVNGEVVDDRHVAVTGVQAGGLHQVSHGASSGATCPVRGRLSCAAGRDAIRCLAGRVPARALIS